MTPLYQSISSRAIGGLAMICAAMAIASFIGQRSFSRLSAEQATNQTEMANLRRQIGDLHHATSQQATIVNSDSSLADAVRGWPLSRVIADLAAKLPNDCRVESIGFDQSTKRAIVQIRCSDVCTFDVDQRFPGSTLRINFRSVGDRSAIGLGWTQDRSAMIVLSVDSTPSPTNAETWTSAN